MANLRDAMSAVPSKPGFVIALLVFLGIGSWHYGTTYMKCSELRDGRNLLRTAIEEAAKGDVGILDLTKLPLGDWDEVRIAQAHNPGATPLHCPFGWDFTWRERQALIENGQYTIIGFFKAGKFQRYIEYRSDWAKFEGDVAAVRRPDAVFRIKSAVDGKSGHLLKRAGS